MNKPAKAFVCLLFFVTLFISSLAQQPQSKLLKQKKVAGKILSPIVKYIFTCHTAICIINTRWLQLGVMNNVKTS